MNPPAKRNDPDRKAQREKWLREGREIKKEADKRADKGEDKEKGGGKK